MTRMGTLTREETPQDISAIHEVDRAAFGQPDEVFMILPLDPGRLRATDGPARYRDEFSMVP